MHTNEPYYNNSLFLMADDFTHQGESVSTQSIEYLLKFNICIISLPD